MVKFSTYFSRGSSRELIFPSSHSLYSIRVGKILDRLAILKDRQQSNEAVSLSDTKYLMSLHVGTPTHSFCLLPALCQFFHFLINMFSLSCLAVALKELLIMDMGEQLVKTPPTSISLTNGHMTWHPCLFKQYINRTKEKSCFSSSGSLCDRQFLGQAQ